MRVKLMPRDDGNFDVFVKKTRQSEGPSIMTENVPEGRLNEVVAEVVSTVSNGGVRPSEVE